MIETAKEEDMTPHLYALRAVSRDRTGVPNCPDRLLIAAADAGLIEFKAWPSGHWKLTAKGRAALSDHA
jgi:hypothetical protein